MYKELHFDTWGTLVDNYSIADVIEPHVYESHLAQCIAQDWRQHQKWAMFYTTQGGEKGDQISPNVRVERIPQKDSTQVLLTSSFGVVRTDEARVARFRHAVP